jgi:Domain of unknown function (DUF3471)
VGTGPAEIKLSPAILNRYTGTYKEHDGDNPLSMTVTVADGRLYLNAYPLAAESETKFNGVVGTVEFFMDANGNVSHIIIGAVEDPDRLDPLR